MNFDLLRDYLDTMKHTPYSETYVMQDHEVLFHHRTGLDDIETGARCKPNGFYYIFSCSKVLTCTAALHLWERGAYLLTDPVSEYLPAFADIQVKDPVTGELRPPKRPMQIIDLFTMSSGLQYMLSWPALEEAKREKSADLSTVEVINTLAKQPLSFDPGERFQYSLSHDVLGALIEVISGKRFGDYLRDEILLPLGMAETGFRLPAGCEDRKVTPYEVDVETGAFKKAPFYCRYAGLSTEYESGGAGLLSTPADYILLADALACGGTGKSGARILSPSTVDMMRTPLYDLNFDYLVNGGYRYGLGVRTMAIPHLGNSPLGEFGWDGACGCYILSDPKNRLSMYVARYVSPQLNYYHSPRLRNVLYACLDR